MTKPDNQNSSESIVYTCPECGTGMQVDHHAKPSPPFAAPAMPNGVEGLVAEFRAASAAANKASTEPWDYAAGLANAYDTCADMLYKHRAADNRDAAGVVSVIAYKPLEGTATVAWEGERDPSWMRLGAKFHATPTAAPAGEAVAFVDDRLTLSDVASALTELVEKYEPGERAPLTDDERAVLVDFVTGMVDEPIFKAVAGHYFAQNPRPGTHPPAAEVREVDEATFAQLALAYMERHDTLSLVWGDMAALSQEQGTAALSPPGRAEGEDHV